MGRLTFVLGKGGVGRTTVARSLALASSRRRPTLLIHSARGAEEERLTPTLTVRREDPKALLDRAVHRILPLGPLTSALTRHPAYDSFTEIAPALRELAFLDAIERRSRGPTSVIVDGPATGHGLHFLQAPAKATDILVGRLKARAQALLDALVDPARTRVVIVTLPEELPVIESVSLLSDLRAAGFHVPFVVVNRVPPPVPVDTPPQGPADASGATPAQALMLLGAARAQAEHWIARLRPHHDHVLILPFIASFSDVEERLSAHLEALA